MNWSDERYVRVFTRDTSDWVELGWEAQALFLFLLRKVDRAGVYEMGRSGEDGLARMLCMPLDVVRRALPILLSDGCVSRSGSQLLIGNFLEAQESRQSDRQRQFESRARRRERAIHTTPQASTRHTASHDVTERDKSERGVTARDVISETAKSLESRHSTSHGVTTCHSVPSVPSVPYLPPYPPTTQSVVTDPDPEEASEPDRSTPTASAWRPRYTSLAQVSGNGSRCAKCGTANSPFVLYEGRTLCRACYEPPAVSDEERQAARQLLAGWPHKGPA